jgi:putative SOS response-associated peptidase YedK
MCQRYIQTSNLAQLQACLPLTGGSRLTPRHNIRPRQQVPVIHRAGKENRLISMRWGVSLSGSGDDLVPACDATSCLRENDLLQRRCLIPADGFYEHERRMGQRVQPWLVRLIEDGPFCFAGIWQRTADAARLGMDDGCALLTVPDRGIITPLATQIPVILAGRDYADWLDPDTDLARISALLRPYRESGIYWHPVGADILHTELDVPSLAAPAQLLAA